MALSQGLPTSRLVSVQVVMTTPGVTAETVNSCMVLGTSPVIDAVERMRGYADIDEVAQDFESASDEYQSAALWFAQAPRPLSLFIGRWVDAAAAGANVGGVVPPANRVIDAWNAIADGSFSVAIDGGAASEITGLDFSGALNLNGVAAVIQTALPAGVTMVWNAAQEHFVMTSATTGATSSVSYLSAAATGTDISGLLQMGATGGGYLVAGQAAESALSALTMIDDMYSGQFYGVVCPAASASDHEDLALYCEAADPPHYYGATTGDPATLNPLLDTDLASLLMDLGFNRSAVQFSFSSKYAIMSYLARILTTQWSGQNTTITLMYKQQPGVKPEQLTSGQADTLKAKNCNVYVGYSNGANIIEYGTSASGQFTDTIIGADAYALDLQAALFNVMYTTPTKVPQTDPGAGLLVTAAARISARYVANRWLAPGTWNAPGFGTLSEGDLLNLGYYIYMPSMLTQDEADRAARRAPLMQIAAKTAGAIHTASILVYVNQ